MLRVQQICMSLDDTKEQIPYFLAKKLRIPVEDILSYTIIKESIDARKKADIHKSYIVDCTLRHEQQVAKKQKRDVVKSVQKPYPFLAKGTLKLKERPVVVGFGPAGMFAALLLAQMGYHPLVLERGACVEKRVQDVAKFWREGILQSDSNVQFGEGGAGTFSDGKLTTRGNDPRIVKILEEYVRFGAPLEIQYQAHPHIGTDVLRGIVKNIREEILRLGGEIRFATKVDDFVVNEGKLCAVVAKQEQIPCTQLILAIGHSARDTFDVLMKRGFHVEAKAFAIGARIEHPQSIINAAQYKTFVDHPQLPPAEYRLVHTASNGRGVYTFCMCPGGYVVPSTSMQGGVVVNGMSNHARDGRNANSAILVQIHPSDFRSDPRLGIHFQEELERKAYHIAKESYRAPAQLVIDFLKHQPSTQMKSVVPSYALGVTPCDLHDLLPAYVCEAMEEGIQAFDHKLNGFAMADAVLTGVETRSSSPIRIVRDKEAYQSTTIQGVYPCGEGAGYAGGIVSAAVDGLRCAEKLISTYDYTKNAS